jgi:hypothetical protein
MYSVESTVLNHWSPLAGDDGGTSDVTVLADTNGLACHAALDVEYIQLP